MNRGCNFYLSKGINLSFKAARKASFKTKCTLAIYFVVAFLARLILFTRPIVEMADQNMAAMIEGSRNISFEKMFTGVTKKRYWDLLLSYLMNDLIIISFYLVCCAIPCLLLMVLGGTSFALVIHFIIGIGGLIPVALVFLNEAPLSFVATKTNDLDASDYMHNAKIAMQGNRKTVFVVDLLHIVLDIVTYVLVALFFVFISKIQSPTGLVFYIVLYLLGFAAIFYFVIMRFLISFKTTRHLIFKDVAKTDKAVVVKPVNGAGNQYAAVFAENKPNVVAMNLNSNKEVK